MIYAGSIGTQIANELLDFNRSVLLSVLKQLQFKEVHFNFYWVPYFLNTVFQIGYEHSRWNIFAVHSMFFLHTTFFFWINHLYLPFFFFLPSFLVSPPSRVFMFLHSRVIIITTWNAETSLTECYDTGWLNFRTTVLCVSSFTKQLLWRLLKLHQLK